MSIGIIGAIEKEVIALKDNMVNVIRSEKSNYTFHSGEIGGVKIILLQSGIGKVAAAMGTTLLLDNYQVNGVINTGSAGGIGPSVSIGDIVISTEVCYHDVGVDSFGYQPGQMADQPARFTAHSELVSSAERALRRTHSSIPFLKGLICTGDSFVCTENQKDVIRNNFPNAIAVDMEASAVAQVCYHFNVPFLVLRAVSDVADKQSLVSYNRFLTLATENASRAVLNTLEQIHSGED